MRASRQQRAADTMVVRRALDRLIALQKLNPSNDGRWLTNGRANVELGKAQHRIQSAVNAGFASGRRRANLHPTASQPRANLHPTTSTSRKNNDLERTRVRNHQPSTTNHDHKNITDAARDPAPSQAPGRAPAKKPDPILAALAAEARRKLMKGE